VKLNEGTVDIEFDPNTIRLEKIKNEVEDQGYDVSA